MKICMWGNIASALEGKTDGGGQLQIALLAKALAKSGHEVIILDFEAKTDFVTADGIKVLPINGWNDGIRFIRFFTHRIPKLYLSLLAQKADVYYCRISDFRHILAFWASHKVHARFILGLASDRDVTSFLTRIKYQLSLTDRGGLWWFTSNILTEIVYYYLLRRSDLVLAQHEGQKNLLIKKNIRSEIFNNLIDLNEIPMVTNPNRQDFCYVGGLDKRKGIDTFFKLIEKSPMHTFKIIGVPRDKTGFLYFNKLKSFKNVKLLGKLPHSETLTHILNSKALISTSPMEGFPNIFIEAWACGIPVLSLHIDPGSVIAKEDLGMVADGDKNKLLHAMATIENTKIFENRAKAYVERNHVFNSNRIKEISCLFSEPVNLGKQNMVLKAV
jgi:glycosyltransferase involved in cell wall biosynthesis